MSIGRNQLAIVLVGTDVSKDGQRLSPQSLAITEKGAMLAIDRMNVNPLIIPSGGNGSKFIDVTSLTEAELIELNLKQIFKLKNIRFPGERIIIEKTSKNTFDNAVNTLRIIKNLEKKNEQIIEQVIIVSWQPHSPRVKLTFNAVFRLNKKHFKNVFFVTVRAPLGKEGENSQKRLTNAFYWFVWNYVFAYEATIFMIFMEFIRSNLGFKQK
jgi:hypothetical protein